MAALTGAAMRIKTEIADLFSNSNFIFDQMAQEGWENAQKGDSVEVGSLAAMSINSDGSTDQTAEDPTYSALTLTADQEPLILQHLKRRHEQQMIGGGGNWSREIARLAVPQMKNYMDRYLLDYLQQTLCYDTSATYHTNVAGDTLTYDDFLNAKAKLMSQRGSDIARLKFVIDAYAEGAVQSFPTFTRNMEAGSSDPEVFGASRVGAVAGIPVYVTAEVPGSDARGAYTVTSTSWAIVTNELTVTVAAGHGLVPGQKCTFDTATAGGDMATSTAITSVTATTVVFAWTASDDSATEAGTISLSSTVNFLVDVGHVHVAQDGDVMVEIVKRPDSTGHNLQISPLYGAIGRAGRVNLLNSPRLAV